MASGAEPHGQDLVAPLPPAEELAVLRRVAWRLLPFLFVLYVAAYLDRVNVGFAALQMKRDLGFSDTVYGLGAGLFFIGYALCEVPSNLVLARTGARLWIARIMVVWGVVSAATMFVTTAGGFNLLRFLLGVAEAGFFPGMLLYLTYWFPAAWRARAVAGFMTATAVAGVIGGPVSGAALALDGLAGLAGWQWLFLLEGLPSVVLGVLVFCFLTDRPEQARWLSPRERDWLAGRMRHEHALRPGQVHSLRQALTSGRVWLLAAVYFLLVTGLYGVTFWLPETVRGLSGWDDVAVALASAVPYLAAAAGMVVIGGHSDRRGERRWVVIGGHSDRRGERRWHVAGPAFLGALGLALSAGGGGPLVSLAALSLGAVGIWGALGPFWALPTASLRGVAAAGGIALINSVGNLGGFVGPYLVGYLRDHGGGPGAGLLALAAALVAGGALALTVRHDPGQERAFESGFP